MIETPLEILSAIAGLFIQILTLPLIIWFIFKTAISAIKLI